MTAAPVEAAAAVAAGPAGVALLFVKRHWRGMLATVSAALLCLGLVGLGCSLMAPAVHKAQDKADVAADRAHVADVDARGAAALAPVAAAADHRERAARDRLAAVARQAGAAPDANVPIPPDRAARLLDYDRFLCGVAPASCGRPATGAEGAGAGGDAAGGGAGGGQGGLPAVHAPDAPADVG